MALESYLRDQKANGKDKGQRTLLHLMAHVAMTEAELLQASFASKKIKCVLATDPKSGRADAMLLEYTS